MKQGAFLMSNNSQYFQFYLNFVAAECMQDSSPQSRVLDTTII